VQPQFAPLLRRIFAIVAFLTGSTTASTEWIEHFQVIAAHPVRDAPRHDSARTIGRPLHSKLTPECGAAVARGATRQKYEKRKGDVGVLAHDSLLPCGDKVSHKENDHANSRRAAETILTLCASE
jgi:hypothetical protein